MLLNDRVKHALIIYAGLLMYVMHQARDWLFDEQNRLKLSGHPIPAPVIIIGLALLADYLSSFWS